MRVDAGEVEPVLDPGSTQAWQVRAPAGSDPSTLEVTYLLDVAQLSNAPAQPGRFIGLLASLTAGVSWGLCSAAVHAVPDL